MTRIMLFKSGCDFCLEWLRILEKINMRLPLHKRIIAKDAFEWENFQIPPHPIFEKFDQKDFDSYPFFFIDGAIIKGGLNAEQNQILLESYLKDELDR